MTSVLFRMADVNVGYLKVKMDLLKAVQEYARKRIQHVFVDRIDNSSRIFHDCEVLIEKSVPRFTVWHHKAPPSDAKL